MNPAELHTYVHDCFTEAFGKPHQTLAGAAQWSLGSNPGLPPVNVLLNGAADQTSVWVFDPHPPNGDEPLIVITARDQVDDVIARITQCVSRMVELPSIEALDVPARIDGFVRGVRAWTTWTERGAAGPARIETEKVRIFGHFLVEDPEFVEAFERNRRSEFRLLDQHLGLHGMCTYLDAVADLAGRGPQRSMAGARG